MTYEEKLKIANDYLDQTCGLSWDDFGDINSLHDCEDKESIISYCDDRLADSGFPLMD